MLFMAIYPTFAKDTSLMEKMLANYPKELIAAFGMNAALPLSSILGYLVFIFPFIQLFIAIQAANYGFSFLSMEERELTADFLLSKPVSRQKILFSKFLAAFTALTITNSIIWISTFASIELFKGESPYDTSKLLVLLSSIVIFQLFFLCFGMLVSVSIPKIRNVLSFSMALAIGTYVLNMLRAIVDGNILGVFTPFYHFDPGYILENESYNMNFAIISILFIVISLITSYFLYIKRNIHSL
jgi:ABC-2 type transport system permease protein